VRWADRLIESADLCLLRSVALCRSAGKRLRSRHSFRRKRRRTAIAIMLANFVFKQPVCEINWTRPIPKLSSLVYRLTIYEQIESSNRGYQFRLIKTDK